MSTASSNPETSTARRRPPLIALMLGLATVAALMLLAFATPALHSGAEDLPVAVAGPEPVLVQVQARLEQQAPGTFEVTTLGSAQEVTDAILDREVVGGLVLAPEGVTVQTASGAGAPYTAVLKGVGAGLEAAGQQVTYTDVVPLPAKDPAGTALASLGLPLIFGGMATAVVMATQTSGATRRVLGALGVAVLAGLAATAILQLGFDALEGNFWLTAAAVSLGMAAIAMTVLGLESWLGYAGLGLGAVLMLFVANPLSGMATGPQWLPAPWGEIGQYLPVGAAATAIRSAAYFDGGGMQHALVVLVSWALGGLLLTVLGSTRRARAAARPA